MQSVKWPYRAIAVERRMFVKRAIENEQKNSQRWVQRESERGRQRDRKMENNSIPILIHSIGKMLRTWSHQLMSLILTPFCHTSTHRHNRHCFKWNVRLKNAYFCFIRVVVKHQKKYAFVGDRIVKRIILCILNLSLFPPFHHLTRPLLRWVFLLLLLLLLLLLTFHLFYQITKLIAAVRFIEANNLQHWNFSSK